MTVTTETKAAPRWPELWLWADVETSGLDPHADLLLEIGARATVPTKAGLEEVGVPFGAIFQHHPLRLGWVRDHGADPAVRKMHNQSGLWDAAQTGATPAVATLCSDVICELWRAWKAWLEPLTSQAKRVYLAGRNVHFDRAWLKAWGFSLDGISHRHVDVSTLARVGATMGLKPPRTSIPHRALADVNQEIEEMRWWLRALRGGAV